MSQCQFNSCTRPSERNGKCILHCEKEDYSEDFGKGSFLQEFHDALADKIKNLLWKKVGNSGNFTKPMLGGYLGRENTKEKHIRDIEPSLEHKNVVLREIRFPGRKNRDDFDYCDILKKIHSIHFKKCEFQAWNLDLNDTKVFFDECTFKNDWNIYDFELLGNDRNVIHQICTFEKDVYFNTADDDEKYSITSTPFSDCQFLQKLSIENVIIKRNIFQNTEVETLDLKRIDIKNSVFDGRFILNQYKIEKFQCEKSTFDDKLELKNCRIKELLIDDCNYSSLVDFFGTNFDKLTIHKSIFENYVGFEDCNFGDSDRSDPEFISKFKYVTFLDFVNFRNSDFKSGLNLDHVNLNEPPNFLNVNVNPKNTTRETFRIIKHSFDRIGNFVEGNNFYKYEMLKLKEETKPNKSRSKYWLLKIYELTSSYGQSYLRPFLLIIVLSIIYWLLNIGYENNWLYKIYPEINNEINWVAGILNGISSNIIPFKRILKDGMESISLIFYIIFSALIWLVILAIKRNTKR